MKVVKILDFFRPKTKSHFLSPSCSDLRHSGGRPQNSAHTIMTKWMTSGASRLKANLNRSFGARKNKKAAANCRVKSYDTVVASAKIGERRKNSNGKSRCRVQRNPVMASIGRQLAPLNEPLIVFYYFDIALFSVNYFLGICCDAASCSHSFYPISCASYGVVESRLRERGNIYSSD